MYQYPSDEAITDAVEARQDPHKRLREIAIVQAMMGFAWTTAMDFGCGKGRNLPLFHRARTGNGSRLIAVDADAERLAAAQQLALPLCSPTFAIDCVAAGVDGLRHVAPAGSLDLILCCQVLGHTSVADFASAMDSFARLLRPDGALILCVPFHGLPFTGDYFHEVDLRSTQKAEPVRRRELNQSQFDLLTQSNVPDRLPVRAFRVDTTIDIVGNVELPFCIEPPSALRGFGEFRASSCLAYSVHEYAGGKAVIGDLAVKLIRSAQ